LKLDAREVFGGDVSDLVRDGRCDVALAPMTTHPPEIRQQTVRREVVRLVVGERHPLAERDPVELASLRDERFELWPRDMSPGFYDAIVGACRAAGFEPKEDPHGAGSTVWGYIAEGRGIGLMVSSLSERLPRDVKLVDLAPPRPMLTINAVWRRDNTAPAIARFLETAKELAQERRWS
jgi:DNA-binding transcriptional LysR family regulator